MANHRNAIGIAEDVQTGPKLSLRTAFVGKQIQCTVTPILSNGYRGQSLTIQAGVVEPGIPIEKAN